MFFSLLLTAGTRVETLLLRLEAVAEVTIGAVGEGRNLARESPTLMGGLGGVGCDTLEVSDSIERICGGDLARDFGTIVELGGTNRLLENIAAAAADMAALEAADSDSLVETVQSLDTDFRPSEWVGETGNTLETKDVDKSKGLSSKTLSTNLLKRVCLKYWMAGRRKVSSGRSGTKKQTSSVLGSISLINSNMGSPVGPLVPIRFTESLYTKE